MTTFKLRPYQEEGAYNVAKMLASGKRKVLFQMATGSGKTATFSAITDRFIKKSKKSVLILVHRDELLKQTVRTLNNFCGIKAAPIIAGVRKVPIAPCYVSMVETANNRLRKNPNFFGEIGLLITDEAHLGNHFKIYDYFPESYIVGFSATPLSARKDKPLKNYFDDIVCGIDIPELISRGNLCQNITYGLKGTFDRSTAKISKGEFAEREMADEYKKSKSVMNTLIGYKKYLLNEKTVVFNVNVSHSELVNETFVKAGLNSRHLDANCGKEYRKECLDWLNKTPDAILHNVGILTTGFDEPSIRGIIVNKSTLSLPLWLQMCGRGGRPDDDKDNFIILDMGGNGKTFGDWDAPRDWYDLFHNPPKKGEGVAPAKDCPQCERLLPASARLCPECGYIFETETKTENYDQLAPVFEVVTKSVNVKELIEKNKHRKAYYPFYAIGQKMALDFRSAFKGQKFNDTAANRLLDEYHIKAREWCHENGKRYNEWHREQAKQNLFKHLSKYYPSWNQNTQ